MQVSVPAIRRRLLRLAARFEPAELVALAALLAGAAGIWAFLAIVEEVLEGDTRTVDRYILLALRTAGDPADPIGPKWLEQVFIDLTALGGVTVITLLALLTFGYLALLRRWSTAFFVLLTLAGGALLNSLLKSGFERPRPDLVPHAVEVQTASFPSGHAMLAAIAYLTLGALLARLEPHWRLKAYIMGTAVTFALLIGVSRVYLGVHWPSDVLAGWCVGASWAIACWFGAQLVAARRRGRRPDDPAR